MQCAAAIAYCKDHPAKERSLADLYDAIELELGRLFRLTRKHGEDSALADYLAGLRIFLELPAT